MRKSVIGIHSNNEFLTASPYIYNGTQWIPVRTKVYSGGWLDVGGAGELLYNFLESTGLFYNSTHNILIRVPKETDRWLDCNGNVMYMTDHYVTTGPNAELQIQLVPRSQKFYLLKDSDGNILKDTDGSIHNELIIRR